MKKEKVPQADVTERLNALIDDLADLAADLHAEGKLQPRSSPNPAATPTRRVRRSRSASSSKPTVSSTDEVSSAHADKIASVPQPERTRLHVLISAWWTLAHMENTGISFGEFIAAAVSNEPRAKPLWDDLTARLHTMVAAELEHWPEAVMSPEAREFIKAIVTGMMRSEALDRKNKTAPQ